MVHHRPDIIKKVIEAHKNNFTLTILKARIIKKWWTNRYTEAKLYKGIKKHHIQLFLYRKRTPDQWRRIIFNQLKDKYSTQVGNTSVRERVILKKQLSDCNKILKGLMPAKTDGALDRMYLDYNPTQQYIQDTANAKEPYDKRSEGTVLAYKQYLGFLKDRKSRMKECIDNLQSTINQIKELSQRTDIKYTDYLKGIDVNLRDQSLSLLETLKEEAWCLLDEYKRITQFQNYDKKYHTISRSPREIILVDLNSKEGLIEKFEKERTTKAKIDPVVFLNTEIRKALERADVAQHKLNTLEEKEEFSGRIIQTPIINKEWVFYDKQLSANKAFISYLEGQRNKLSISNQEQGGQGDDSLTDMVWDEHQPGFLIKLYTNLIKHKMIDTIRFEDFERHFKGNPSKPKIDWLASQKGVFVLLEKLSSFIDSDFQKKIPSTVSRHFLFKGETKDHEYCRTLKGQSQKENIHKKLLKRINLIVKGLSYITING